VDGSDIMTDDITLPHDILLERLHILANASLHLWDLPDAATAEMINLSENATYLVSAPGGYRAVLRVHRDAYHSDNAIRCELAWMEALNREGGVATPPAIPGKNGELIQTAGLDGLPHPRRMVLFEFLEGEEPDENADLVGPFEELGEIAARTHVHAMSWQRPANFERLIWDCEHILGPVPNWGDWHAAPAMEAEGRAVLERQEAVIRKRLAAFGQGRERFGLIHADMRLANLLIDNGSPRLIDFDDCGLGWHMYDFAAGVSLLEDSPQLPALREAWVKGYRKVIDLPAEDEAEIDTFVMLRRMALLAWMGSHPETDLARGMGAQFTKVSVGLAEDYLARFG
jgi:Ser/Thr protein kinase RdoA (MazF antagonist)